MENNSRGPNTGPLHFIMKYYYEKPKTWTNAGQTYICVHPLYNRCTLFTKGKKGLAVIQEHFNEDDYYEGYEDFEEEQDS